MPKVITVGVAGECALYVCMRARLTDLCPRNRRLKGLRAHVKVVTKIPEDRHRARISYVGYFNMNDDCTSLPSPPKIDTITTLTRHRGGTADMRSCTSGNIRAFHFRRQRPKLDEASQFTTEKSWLTKQSNNIDGLGRWLMVALHVSAARTPFLFA